MGAFIYLAFFAALIVAAAVAGFYLAIPVAAAAGGTGLVAALGQFAVSGVRGFGGDAPLDDLRILPRPDGEPAYRSYFQGPVIREFRIVVAHSAEAVIARIRRWIERAWTQFRAFDSIYWKIFAFLPAIACTAGLVVGGILAAVLIACVALVAGLVLLVVVVLGRLVGLILRGVELSVLAVRGITLECPNCRNRVTRPIYRCSGEHGCDAAHQRLEPGGYGILHRVCRCSRSLPTLLVLGKLKLLSQCSHCEFQLPLRGYSAPTLHIPVAGGPQVGKSVFMFASVKRLYDGVGGDNTTKQFWADEAFLTTFVQTARNLESPDRMRKTTESRPNAYNIYLGSGTHRRLLYLYDSAGEIYQNSHTLAQADFYRFTKGVVLCIDPFSLAGLRERVDRSVLDNVRSLDTNPKQTLEVVAENLREWRTKNGSGKLPVKLAVVLTKADALAATRIPHPYAGLPQLNGDGPRRADRDAAVRQWIEQVGVQADLVSSIVANFETVSFFVVSHRDAASTDQTPQRASNDDPADPVQWILNRGAFA